MNSAKLPQRCLFFAGGLFSMALGIAIITKANLGIPPISSVPYVFSIIFPLSFGITTFIINALMVVAQVLLLKKNFEKRQYLQLLVAVFFGFSIDFCLWILTPLHPTIYWLKMILILVGGVILAFGIAVQVNQKLIFVPGEGLVKALSDILNKEFGSVKVAFDVFLVILSIGISAGMFGKIEGIREGTVILAMSVGWLVRFFQAASPVAIRS